MTLLLLLLLFALFWDSKTVFLPDLGGSIGAIEINNDVYIKGKDVMQLIQDNIDALNLKNTEFSALNDRIDSLEIEKTQELSALNDRIDTLESEKNQEISAVDGKTQKIGDIQHSILSEEEFQTLRGLEWDGRALAVDNPLRLLTSWTNLPDARGRFLRTKDNGAGVDPTGDVLLGTLEDDTTKFPVTGLSISSNNHAHTGTTGVEDDARMYYDHTGNPNKFVETKTGGIWMNIRQYGCADCSHRHSFTTSTAGHSHSVSGGDAETRPKNMVVNTFIKIE